MLDTILFVILGRVVFWLATAIFEAITSETTPTSLAFLPPCLLSLRHLSALDTAIRGGY